MNRWQKRHDKVRELWPNDALVTSIGHALTHEQRCIDAVQAIIGSLRRLDEDLRAEIEMLSEDKEMRLLMFAERVQRAVLLTEAELRIDQLTGLALRADAFAAQANELIDLSGLGPCDKNLL